MGFDDEVDAARLKLEAALAADTETESAYDAAGALRAILPRLKDRIQSRRLAFQLTEDAGETIIEITHAVSEEALGFVFAEDGEYVFESSLEDYFDDFVDEDADSFVLRLYETLRADLPKYEVENG